MKGIQAVVDYVHTQHHKGLLSDASNTAVAYWTHWGTHQKVLFPEIALLAEQHHLIAAFSIGTEDAEGNWTQETSPENQLRADDNVAVRLALGPKLVRKDEEINANSLRCNYSGA